MTDGATSDRGEPGRAQGEETALEDPVPVPAPSPRRKRRFRSFVLAFTLIFLLIAALVVPPLVNIGRYQRRVTALISQSLGRPVRLSSVELRLLPMPGFVLNDLSVGEDPAFGAEPVLSARTVVATVAIFPLWRGKLQISRISVDEASLNLVRNPQGRWNLETLMMGPAQPALTGAPRAPEGKPIPFPYLEATNSRVNLKNGLEKSPFSIVNTDLSLWQDQPGLWRVRLRGQPLRTDLSLSREADGGTGDIRLEASLHSAARLGDMPFQLEMEWRDAQLGQLSRLLLGSDAGWRGDLTANVRVEGTAESAQTRARLRATGVRREEFAPETPLDFDANCTLLYQHALNAFRNIDCGTAIGNGRLHLKADLPGNIAGNAHDSVPQAMLEVKDVPVQAGLDMMRTLRNSFAPGIEAKGTLNGSLTYRRSPQPASPPARHPASRKTLAKSPPGRSLETNIEGSLTGDGILLTGGGLREPLIFPKTIWTPAPIRVASGGPKSGIETKITVPIAPASTETSIPGQTPVPNPAQSVVLRIGLNRLGYNAEISGSATPAKLRSLAYAFGIPQQDSADGFAGGTADFDLTATGLWVPPSAPEQPSASLLVSSTSATGTEDFADSVTGSLQLHHTHWQAPYLSRPVDLQQANVYLTAKGIDLGSDFTFGTLKGSLAVTAPTACNAPECVPDVQLRFAALDAAAAQTALRGAPRKQSLLSPLMDRMRSNEKPAWPAVALSLSADTLALGPVTLRKPVAQLHFVGGKVVVQKLDAAMLGGDLHLTGSFETAAGVPQYTVEGAWNQIRPEEIGALFGTHLRGGTISGTGSLSLSGTDSTALAASAKGQAHFEWREGSLPDLSPKPARFESWNGVFQISSDGAQLGENELLSGRHRSVLSGASHFLPAPKLTLTTASAPAPAQPSPKPAPSAHPVQ